ncbi:hypothetical protein GF357_01870 [Candidatus Dojkabacteria bacterium]|nr:hypothetical protein [Candidatus Dojkabacteria bacterium]
MVLIKRVFKLGLVAIFGCFLVSLAPGPAKAQEANFSIRPEEGYVKGDSEFIIDVLIDSAGEELTVARAVLVFDPEKVEITKVEKHSALFCNWPDDKQTIDQENGVISIFGQCQSGAEDLYSTSGEPDVYARISFLAEQVGDVTFDWEWSGENQEFKSVLMKDGSPPQNILNSKPAPVTYEILEVADLPDDTPDTGFWDNDAVVIAICSILISILIYVIGRAWIALSRLNYEKRVRTRVEID